MPFLKPDLHILDATADCNILPKMASSIFIRMDVNRHRLKCSRQAIMHRIWKCNYNNTVQASFEIRVSLLFMVLVLEVWTFSTVFQINPFHTNR